MAEHASNPGATASPERWLAEQLRFVRQTIAANVIVVDPDGVVNPAVFQEGRSVVHVKRWLDLRRAFEDNDRGRPPTAQPQLIHLASPEFAAGRDLPWDIQQGSTVAVVRWPYARRWLSLYRALDRGAAARLAALLEREPTAGASRVVHELFGKTLPASSPAAELAAVVELRRQGLAPELLSEVMPLLTKAETSGLMQDPPDAAALQAAWADWLSRGGDSPHAPLFTDNSGAVIPLLQDGLLVAVPANAPSLPSWAQLGASQVSSEERVGELLTSGPGAWPPTTAEDWFAAAAWWAELRAQLAVVAPANAELDAQAADWWKQADATFQVWLRAQYGLMLTSSRPRPLTVDKIAPFLARRLRSGTERLMLVVLDGLGLSQWVDLRTRCGLEVVDPGACFAMVPTLTEHSRQSIFAGAPPVAFADDLDDNSKEERHWRCFWTGEGLADREIGYFKDRGASRASVPHFGTERVVGVVALAVDQMLHEAKVLPDPQLAAAVRIWADHGYLSALVERATAAGFEVWLTSDHGNVEAQPLGLLREGDTVDRPGRRVRFYENATLRERSAERHDGIAWDPPGFPAAGRYPLFAAGRGAWILGGAQVIHGGLSLDEMVVPLVRVRR